MRDIMLIITLLFVLFLMFNFGRVYQRTETTDEILDGGRSTLTIKSLGVTIHAPKGMLLTVEGGEK